MAVANSAFGTNLIGDTEVYISSEGQEGFVYLSEEEMDEKDITPWYRKTGMDGISEFWIYAKPKRGYRLEKWQKRDMENGTFYFFNTEQKQKVIKVGTDRFILWACFTPITDPGLFGVPAYFSVYVDGQKVEPDINGDYYIAKGKPVKLTWGDEINCTFDETMAPGDNERFLEFTMPSNNFVLPLTSVTIQDGVTEIKPFAFIGCEKLTNVTIPNTVASIGKQAFMDCNSLKTIIIPNSVTKIGAFAFNRNGLELRGFLSMGGKSPEGEHIDTALEHVYFPGRLEQWYNVSVEYRAFDRDVAIHTLLNIFFNARGHGITPDAQNKFTGEKVIEPEPLTELGYDFGGWYTDEACTEKFDFKNAINNDLWLYAKWTPKENTISFYTGEDGVEIADQKVLTDQKVTKPEPCFYNGEVIEGWYKDKAYNQPYDFNKPVKEPMTLYAKWIKACTVTTKVTNPEGGTCKLLDANGEEVAPGYVYPDKYTLEITSGKNYSFSGTYTTTIRSTGLSTDHNINGINYSEEFDLTQNDLEVNVEFTQTPTVYISAKDDGVATEYSYTLTDGVKPTANSYSDGDALKHVNDENTLTWVDSYNLTLTIDNKKNGCVGTILNNGVNTSITDDQTSYTFEPHGSISISLFFYDRTKNYTLTFKNGDTDHATITQTYGTAVTAPDYPTREGYTFAGWDKPIPTTMPAEDMTITALWKKQITITANSDKQVYNGNPLVNYEYTSTPLEEGDSFESVTITGSQTNVGTSDNVPSAAVIKNAGNEDVTDNYDITYTSGTLEITPKAAIVKADNLMKEHDANDPTLTATITGLAMGDEAGAITYTLSRDKSGTPEGEKAGSYTITPTGEATQGNYTVTYEPGLLTIAPKKGDVNSDESVDETDIQIVTSIIFSGLYISIADVNKDNVVNVADIVTIYDIMNPVFVIDF